MDLLYYGFILLLFIAIALASEALWGWWFAKLSTKAKRLNRRLRQVTSKNVDPSRDTSGLLKSRRFAKSDRMDLLLQRLPGVYRLQAYLMQAGLSWSVSQFLAIGTAIALASFFCLELLPMSIGMVMALSIIASLAPWVYVIHIRSRRLLLLEEQLPEMADFISRSLRAGHAFSVSLQMLVEEMPQPIASEFRIVSDEISFGLPLSEALQRLCMRVPLPDLHYLVVAILIQRETGGNLAELMTKVSQLVRQRLKLQGDVRVLSAEGRMSAWILCLLSPIVAGIFCLTNPDYLQQFIDDPAGVTLLWSVGAMLVLGILVMRFIVRIRV